MAPKLPQFKKPKQMKKLSGFGKKKKLEPLPDLEVDAEPFAAATDDELRKMTLNLGDDEQLAKKILKLQVQYPTATLPELIVIEYLGRQSVHWEFQKWLLGGRVIRGGQVVDFAVDKGMYTDIWEVQGTYWHNRPGSTRLDDAQKFALLGLEVFTKPVKHVIELWESRLVDKKRRSGVLEAAMNSEELGP